jgi:hypothetical protein
MSTWFDKLLEELQRRQAEQDARREGRPLPPREPRRVRGKGGGGRGNGGDDGPPLDDRPTPFPGRRRGGPVDAAGIRRWVVLAVIVVISLFLLCLLV